MNTWLEDWPTHSRKLLIVGSSGGYCLSGAWLARFDEITCLDPDPLARFFFSRQHPTIAKKSLHWDRRNVLDDPKPLRQLEEFSQLIKAHPDATILFSNFLGQLGLLLDHAEGDAPLAVWKNELGRLLKDREWASFHDRLSGSLQLRFSQPYFSTHRMTDPEILRQFYPKPLKARSTELIDHDTEGFFQAEQEHAYFNWKLTRHFHHLIEGVRSPSRLTQQRSS